MAKVHTVESFVEKWEGSIIDALGTIGQSIERAGFAVTAPDSDVDTSAFSPHLRWLIRTWAHGRPIGLESMDLLIAITIVQADDAYSDISTFLPFIEIFNFEGSFLDDIDLSDPIGLDNPSWEEIIKSAQAKAGDIVAILKGYFPESTKSRWKIHATAPENIPLHPSIHTNEEVAQDDVKFRLSAMLVKLERFFWELETLRIYSGWNSASTYALDQTRLLLKQGEAWEALQTYDEFLETLSPSLKKQVIKTVGSLSVEHLGGFELEGDY